MAYYKAFPEDDDLPTLEDYAEYIGDALRVDYATVMTKLRKMDFSNLGRVDENMFSPLYHTVTLHGLSPNLKSDWPLCTHSLVSLSQR